MTPEVLAARLALARDAWDAALLAGDWDEADRCALEVEALERGVPSGVVLHTTDGRDLPAAVVFEGTDDGRAVWRVILPEGCEPEAIAGVTVGELPEDAGLVLPV
jgi:hypothetical protein